MRLAIFPSTGLGDGIIQLLLAQNLAKSGINIDYYHELLADLDNIVEHVKVCRPSHSILKENIDNYDVLLVDHGSKITDLTRYHEIIKSKIACYTMSRTKRHWLKLNKTNLKNTSFLAPTLVIDGKNINLEIFNGRSLRANKYSGLTTAGGIVHFLKRNQLMDEPDYELALSAPGSWQKHKYNNRILIHPTSTNEKKNWLPDRFIKLAMKLKNQGYQPDFIVAPHEKESWNSLIDNRFELPVFNNIFDLAKYYYESALHIGTDSGNGHLASALTLPTITIVNRHTHPFPWCPSWSKNEIIRPLLSKNLVGEHYWKFTVNENHILESIRQILP